MGFRRRTFTTTTRWRVWLKILILISSYVVTPNALHAQHLIAAARAKKHVICEKPMAVSVVECDAMLAACRVNNVKLSIGYRLQFEPHYDELKAPCPENSTGVCSRG